MVEVTRYDGSVAIILRPNRSASWQQTKWLITAFAVLVGIIATGWAFAGAWVILPFAGLEVLALALLFHRVSTDTYKSERLTISARFIDISRGFRRRGFVRFERARTEVTLRDDEENWALPAFYLVTPELSEPIGTFLNEQDRAELKRQFENCGVTVCRKHWWKQ